jgi:hypothetical protein
VFDQRSSPSFDGESIFDEEPSNPYSEYVDVSCHDNGSVKVLQLERFDLAGCTPFLDASSRGYVAYVPFGSLMIMRPVQLQELTLSLLTSARSFLWVFWPELVATKLPHAALSCAAHEVFEVFPLSFRAAWVNVGKLSLSLCWKIPWPPPIPLESLHASRSIGVFPEFLKAEIRASSGVDQYTSPALLGSATIWHQIQSVQEYYKMVDSELFGHNNTKVVVGTTVSGVYRETEVSKEASGGQIGAAVTISEAIETLRVDVGCCNEVIFCKIVDYREQVTSPFVRNTASLGGNLLMAQRDQFAFNIATILLAAGSSICIQASSKRLTVTMEDFLQMPPCDNKTLLLSIYNPHWTSIGGLLPDDILCMGQKLKYKLLCCLRCTEHFGGQNSVHAATMKDQ